MSDTIKRMSDGDVEYHRIECVMPYLYRYQFQEGFRSAESILIPQLESLQEEIERLMLVNNRLMRERDNVLNIKTTDGLTASEWVQRTANAEERVSQLTDKDEQLQSENEALKAKYDALVEGLKEMEYHKFFLQTDTVFPEAFLQRSKVPALITDNGGKNEV